MYLLDTTVWVDLLRTNSPAIRKKLMAHGKSRIGLSIVTLCELQYGIERHAILHPHLLARTQELLSAMIAPFDVVSLDVTVVRIYGRLRAILQSRGTLVGPLDTFIAAQALNLGATLVTSNTKEFSQVPDLLIEDWR